MDILEFDALYMYINSYVNCSNMPIFDIEFMMIIKMDLIEDKQFVTGPMKIGKKLLSQ